MSTTPAGGKRAKAGKGAASAEPAPMSVAAHPRAARSLARAKSWAGLLGFVLVALLSWRAGVAPFELCLRALAAGCALYLVAWAAGVALWRQLVLVEVRTELERRRAEHDARVAAAAADVAA